MVQSSCHDFVVPEPPKVDPFSFLNRKQGNRVSVSCVMSSGDLPVTIVWQKDGFEIASDLGIQIQVSMKYWEKNWQEEGSYDVN